jgi:rhodanese-related sulfurtransferase
MKRFFTLLIFGFLFLVGCGSSAGSGDGKVKNLDAATFKKYLETHPEVQLIDLRTPEEVQGGMIRGAKNINFYAPDFEAQIKQLDPSRPVAVYCAGGVRSAKCANLLEGMAFPEIINLRDGFRAWQ